MLSDAVGNFGSVNASFETPLCRSFDIKRKLSKLKKPRLFLISGALYALGGILLMLGIAMNIAGGMNGIATVCYLLSVMFVTSAILITTVRQEKQHQRNNSKLQTLTLKIDDARHNQLEKTRSLDSGISANELSMGLATLRSAVITPSTVSGKLQRSSEISRTLGIALNVTLPKNSFVPLSREPVTVKVDLDRASRVEVYGVLSALMEKEEARTAVLYAQCFDASGRQIDFRILPSHSDTLGYFTYLGTNSTSTKFNAILDVPRSAVSLSIHFIKWAGYSELSNQLDVKIIEENPQWKAVRRAKDIRVAAILDEFSYNSFRYECNLLSLDPKNWREQIDSFQPDLFLCESAWSGQNSQVRPWKGKVYASTNFKGENRTELLKILAYCSEQGIPTAFWNKEDPSHYEDKVHDFIDTAIKFDHIFTTDLECVERYRQDYGHKSVHVLPFAVQPRMFNPIKRGGRSGAVTFAGGWYSNHEKRSEDMAMIFDAVLKSGRELKIYDRFWDSDDESHEFPDEYQKYLNPPVPNDAVAEVYKESEIGLTINTETDSPTMFARRIFELMACDTYVVSNYSKGVEEFFGENVLFLDRETDGLLKLTSDKIIETRRENLNNVLANHTYENRFEKILQTVNIEHDPSELGTSLVVLISNIEALETVWEKLQRIRDKELAVRSIVITGDVQPTDYARSLTEFNTRGIRLSYLPALGSDENAVSQVVGDSPDALILHSDYFMEKQIEGFSLKEARMHSKYIDLPIVSGSMSTTADPDDCPRVIFTVVDVISRQGFVSRSRSLEFVKDLASGSVFKAYLV